MFSDGKAARNGEHVSDNGDKGAADAKRAEKSEEEWKRVTWRNVALEKGATQLGEAKAEFEKSSYFKVFFFNFIKYSKNRVFSNKFKNTPKKNFKIFKFFSNFARRIVFINQIDEQRKSIEEKGSVHFLRKQYFLLHKTVIVAKKIYYIYGHY